MSIPKEFNLVEYVVIGDSEYCTVYKLYLKRGLPHCHLVEALVKSMSQENDEGFNGVVKEYNDIIAYVSTMTVCNNPQDAIDEPATARCKDWIT